MIASLLEQSIISEWNNIQRIYHDLINGTSRSSVIIKKLSASANRSRTKKAFWQFNNILKSIYVLEYINDEKVQHGVNKAQNRVEAYHKLCRAIGLNKGGKLKGYSELDFVVWNECTRLIASIIIYYNTYILSTLYSRANKPERELLINASPIAWSHVNLLGFYQFCVDSEPNLDQLISSWDWKKVTDFVENE